MATAMHTARLVAAFGAALVLGGGYYACASPAATPDPSTKSTPDAPRATTDSAPPRFQSAGSSAPAVADDTASMLAIDADSSEPITLEQQRAKIEIYWMCFQAVDHPLRGLWYSYSSIVDARWGYARSNWYGFGALKTERVDACLAALETVSSVEPAMPEIDELAASYREHVMTVSPLVEQAREYFGDKQYLTDHWKGAKQMHAPLKQAFAEWLAVSNELRKVLAPAISSFYDQYATELATQTSRGVPYFVERAAFQSMVVMDVLALPGADPEKASAAIESLRTVTKDLASKIKSDAKANTEYLPIVSALTKLETAAIKVRMALAIRGFGKYYIAMYYRMLVVSYNSAMDTYSSSAVAWRKSDS